MASRSGQLLQISDIANSIGVSVNTIKAWLGILEATYQILILRPYFTNTNKRLVKTPKIYMMDVGTLCYLMNLKDVEHLIAGPMAGPIMETYVVTEIYKRFVHRGVEPQMYFWRTSGGEEVDLLLEDQGALIPLEIKVTSTPKPQMAQGILTLQKEMKKPVKNGYLIHLGELQLPLGEKVTALPFSQM